MNIVWVLLATAFVLFLEKTRITNHWNKKEKIVFFVSLLVGTSCTVAWVLQVDLINPMEFLAKIYQPLSEPFVSYMNQFK